MKLKSSIFFKILAFILPLVCLPIALVGYFSIQTSVDRVNRLVRQEQMLQVEAAAKKIDNVLQNTPGGPYHHHRPAPDRAVQPGPLFFACGPRPPLTATTSCACSRTSWPAHPITGSCATSTPRAVS